MRVLLIGIAGAAGALCRYGIGVAVGARSFPWSTLGINVAGSFVLGLLDLFVRADRAGTALVYVVASVAAGMAAAAAGYRAGAALR